MQSWGAETKHYIKFEQIVTKDEKAEGFCKCPICLEIFQDPICCDNCENHFCKTCLATWNQSQPNRRCPLCHDLREKPAQRILKNILYSLQVHCQNKQHGCTQILQYQEYQKHINTECEYKLIKCPNVECDTQVLVKELEEHDEICPYKIMKCQWCKIELQRQFQQEHEEVCEQKCVQCKICEQNILVLDMKKHLEVCPEKQIVCVECQELVKLKNEMKHLEEQCQNARVECAGCKKNLTRHDLNNHILECKDFEVVCPNCDFQMKRKFQVNHTLSSCIQTLKKQLNEQQIDSQQQIDGLTKELMQLKGIVHGIQEMQVKKEMKQQCIRFSLTYKHPEIHLYQHNTLAQIQDAYSILKDRFVYVEIDKDLFMNQPIEIQFVFPSITDRFVAFGIADISNLSQKKDYYKLNHLAYLFSSNGVIYSSHSSEDNGRKKDFRFDSNQKLNLTYDFQNCKVIASNITTGQNYIIDIPAHLIQMHGKSFFPVVCLRGAGDQVQILN